MNEEQIKAMAERFLSWPLPDDFAPDGGIEYHPIGNKGTACEYRRVPTGTNLLNYQQATAMIRHMLAGQQGDV